MNDQPHDLDPLDGLEADARSTALLLRAAFADVRLEHPSPVTTPAQDADTASRLEAAFELVALRTEAPAEAPSSQAELLALPAPARRARRWPAGLAAAAVAVVIAGGLLLGPSGSAPAWATQPRTPDEADVAGVARACAAPLVRGLGDLQSAGSAAVGGEPGSPAPADPAGSAPPSSLPPLVALDVRGDVAFAVYQDVAWTVTCVALADGDGWRDQGVQAGPGAGAQTPGLVAAGGTATVDGTQVTTVTGAVPAGAVRMEFRLDDGTQVQASVRGRTWAAWFPGDRALDPASVTAYDGSGRVVA